MIFEIAIVLLIVILGYKLPHVFRIEDKELKNVRLLWFFHLLFGVVFYFYIMSLGGSDSTKYWKVAKEINFQQMLEFLTSGKATQAMIALNYFPSNFLGLPYFVGNIIYCLIGFVGFLCFYKIVLDLVPYNTLFLGIPIFPIIFFLPNLHFWSSNVGKDTLLFTIVGLFCYSMLNLKKRIPLVILCCLLGFMVRPHIVFFLLVAFGMAYLYQNKIPTYQKLFFFIILFVGAAIVLPRVLDITQMEELSVDSYSEFSQRKAEDLSRKHTGSSIDISSYPFPLKVFTFLFRPTITDVNSAISLVAALENILLLVLFLKLLKRDLISNLKKSPTVIKAMIFMLAIGTVAFSMTLGNMGIMIRMRNMFLPGLIIYILWVFSFRQSKEMEARKIWAIRHKQKLLEKTSK